MSWATDGGMPPPILPGQEGRPTGGRPDIRLPGSHVPLRLT
jgi:hypothetical protein